MKIVIGLTTQNSFMEEAVVFPENIAMLYGIDQSSTVYDALSLRYKKYKNCKLFNFRIAEDAKSLEEFVKENDIQRIDHIHIDTELKDLDVLATLKDKFSILENGELRCQPLNNPNSNLEQNTYEECANFLFSKGYNIHSINTSRINEWCISFSKIVNEQENQSN